MAINYVGKSYLKETTRLLLENDKKINNSLKTEVQKKANQSDLLVERERISNIIKLTNGSTTGDAELADIRIDSDGKTHGTAGDSIRSQVNGLKDDMTELGERLGVGRVLRTSLKCDYNEDVPIDDLTNDWVYTLGDATRIYRDTTELILDIFSKGGEGEIYLYRTDTVYERVLVFKQRYTFISGVNRVNIPIKESYFDKNPTEGLDFLNVAIYSDTKGAFTTQSGKDYLHVNGEPFYWYSPVSDFSVTVDAYIQPPNYWEGNVTTNKTYPCIDVYMKSYIEKRKTGIITVSPNGNGDYTTIKEAIRNAGDIDEPTTILLYEGIYDEVVYLRNKHNISIVGINRDKCIIRNVHGMYAYSPIMVNGDFELRNLTIRMEEQGFYPTYSDANVFATYPGYALHIDGDSKDITKQTVGRVTNCILYSEAFPAVGMGLNQNQKVIFENCEMIRNCEKPYFRRDAWKGAFVAHSSNNSHAPNQRLVLKDCVFKSNYGYSGNIRGDLGQSSEFEVTAINNTFYSDDSGLNSFEYIVGQSVLNSISHGNTATNMNSN